MKYGLKKIIGLILLLLPFNALADWHSTAWPANTGYVTTNNAVIVSNLSIMTWTANWTQSSTTNYIPDLEGTNTTVYAASSWNFEPSGRGAFFPAGSLQLLDWFNDRFIAPKEKSGWIDWLGDSISPFTGVIKGTDETNSRSWSMTNEIMWIPEFDLPITLSWNSWKNGEEQCTVTNTYMWIVGQAETNTLTTVLTMTTTGTVDNVRVLTDQESVLMWDCYQAIRERWVEYGGGTGKVDNAYLPLLQSVERAGYENYRSPLLTLKLFLRETLQPDNGDFGEIGWAIASYTNSAGAFDDHLQSNIVNQADQSGWPVYQSETQLLSLLNMPTNFFDVTFVGIWKGTNDPGRVMDQTWTFENTGTHSVVDFWGNNRSVTTTGVNETVTLSCTNENIMPGFTRSDYGYSGVTNILAHLNGLVVEADANSAYFHSKSSANGTEDPDVAWADAKNETEAATWYTNSWGGCSYYPTKSQLYYGTAGKMWIDENTNAFATWAYIKTSSNSYDLGGAQIETGSVAYVDYYISHKAPSFTAGNNTSIVQIADTGFADTNLTYYRINRESNYVTNSWYVIGLSQQSPWCPNPFDGIPGALRNAEVSAGIGEPGQGYAVIWYDFEYE